MHNLLGGGLIVSYVLMNCLSRPLPPRSARGDGVCLGHPRHGHLCSPDDVHHHAAHRLLHCLGVWRRDDSHAVLATHQVTPHQHRPRVRKDTLNPTKHLQSHENTHRAVTLTYFLEFTYNKVTWDTRWNICCLAILTVKWKVSSHLSDGLSFYVVFIFS